MHCSAVHNIVVFFLTYIVSIVSYINITKMAGKQMFWEEPFDHLSASYTRSTMICMYYWSLYTKWNNTKARLLADENKETSARFIEHGHKKS